MAIGIGKMYKTQKSGVRGVIVEMVPNRTGSTRLRLLTFQNGLPAFRWTTYVPPKD